MLDWAKWWVAQGCAVFPLPPLRKKASGLGIKSATTDPMQIDLWWQAEPLSNIGVVGDPAATDKFLLRIDVDVKKGGMQAWDRLTTANTIPPTLTVRTPSGGRHFYFWSTEPLTNTPGILPPGIDVRGHNNGYTVGAPSRTMAIEGESVEGGYEIENVTPIVFAPTLLVDLLMARQVSKTPSPVLTLADEVSPDAYQDLRDALLSPVMLRDWERWSDNGLALLSLGDVGYGLWCEYSARQLEACPDYPPGTDDADSWWARHVATQPKSDYRSIFARAQGLGWRNPKAVDRQQLGFGRVPIPTPPGSIPVPPGISRFRLLDETEFANGEEPEWRVDKLIPQQGLGMIYGPPGIGKSFMVLDLAMSVADGRPYGIDLRAVKPGRAVYVLGEGAAGMRTRVRAYRQRFPCPHSQFKVIATAPNLMNPGDVGELMQLIVNAGGADMIIFDTLHSCMSGGDENSAKDMGVVLANCRALGAAINGFVMLIHHTGKDAERGARGSTAIPGAMEVEIEIKRAPKNANLRIIKVRKQRDGEDNYGWSFRLDPVIGNDIARPFQSAIITHLQEQDDAPEETIERKPSNEQEFVVNQAMAMMPQYPNGLPLEVLMVGLQRLRADMAHSSIKRCVTRAIDRGLMAIDSDGCVKAIGRETVEEIKS